MTISIHRICRALITIVLSICCVAIAYAQSQDTPVPPESRQLEFWEGDWNIQWDTINGGLARGKNIAGYILERRVFQENWDGRPGMNMTGKSWFVFDARRKLWQQIWVSDQGEFSLREGRFMNGELVMKAVKNEISATGVEFEIQSIYRDIKDDSFKVEVQRRRTGTDKWNTIWLFEYKRNK